MENGFSIVMPHYNSSHLRRAVESVNNQTYNKWELIIVDNYSNNSPERIIEEFNNKKISFFKFNNNNNIGSNIRNYK